MFIKQCNLWTDRSARVFCDQLRVQVSCMMKYISSPAMQNHFGNFLNALQCDSVSLFDC